MTSLNSNYKRRSEMVKYKVGNYTHLGSILFFTILLGCGATKTVFYKQPYNKIAKYQVIEIPNFNKTDKEWVPYDSGLQIPDMVAEKLRADSHFNEIRRSESNVTSEERVLLVEGTVTGYKPGCKLCEWYIRINDKGKSSVSVRVKLVDKATGDIIVDAGIEGRAKKPGYGNSRYIRITDEIVRLIEDVNNKKL
jgi:hypothetical protein